MRKLLLLALAAATLAPGLTRAEEARWLRGGPPPRASSRQIAPRPPREGTALRGPAPVRPPTAPAPRVVYGPWDYSVGVDAIPFWLGWSWGWGYYPLWPRPDYPGYPPGELPDDARRVAARLDLYGAGASNGGAAGSVALMMEGPIAGFSADVSGLAVPDATGHVGSGDPLTLGGARATWSVVSDAAFRLRLEAGGAMLSVPANGMYATTTYAGSTFFGPQVGVSGQLGLLGPFGIQGYARVMPFPVSTLDVEAAFVVRGGPLAVSAGWRSIDVNGDRVDAPEAHFAGPELGLQLIF